MKKLTTTWALARIAAFDITAARFQNEMEAEVEIRKGAGDVPDLALSWADGERSLKNDLSTRESPRHAWVIVSRYSRSHA